MDGIILDLGSGYTKAGYVGSNTPSSHFPSLLGQTKVFNPILGAKLFLGDEAWKKRGILQLRYPVQHGQVTDWNDAELLLKHCFHDELRVQQKDRNILVIDTPNNSASNRIQLANLLFEKYEIGGLHISNSAVLALQSTSRTTGLVFESGDGVTSTVPVYDSRILKEYVQISNVAGQSVTEFMKSCLEHDGYSFQTSAELEIVKAIKEKLCYLTDNFENTEKECNANQSKYVQQYELPDGNVIDVFESLFKAPELLFDPSLNGIKQRSVVDTVKDCIDKCAIDVRAQLINNVVICGGNTLFKNFDCRFQQEVNSRLGGKSINIVNKMQNRKFCAFEGASLIASLDSFHSVWITRNEWLEDGDRCIAQKCK